MKKHGKRTRPYGIVFFIIIICCFGGIFIYSVNFTSLAENAAMLSAFVTMPDGIPDYLSSNIFDQMPEEIYIPDIISSSSTYISEASESQISISSSEVSESKSETSSQISNDDEIAPKSIDNRKKIETTYAAIPTNSLYIKSGNGYIKNSTKFSPSEIKSIISKKPDIQIDKNDIQVLIFHTHATESFDDDNLYALNPEYAWRTTDKTKNMCYVGGIVAKQLEAAGIGVIHDTTLHDYPSYNGSYDKSSDTIDRYLKEYPNIQIIIDLHRDAIAHEDGTMVKPIAEINGKKAAQIMIIAGCGEGEPEFSNWRENLRFASMIQNSLETMYPTLTRPIMFCYRKYNMHKASGSLLIEIGSHGNSLEEAAYSGELLGKSLVDVIAKLKK